MENTQNSAEEPTIQDSGNTHAEDVNKEPKEQTSKAKVKKPSRKVFVIAMGVLAVAIGIVLAGYFLVYKPANDYAIKVGSEKVTKSEYDDLIQQAKGENIDEKKAKEIVIDSLRYQQAASSVELNISDALRDSIAAIQYNKEFSDLNNWQQHQINALAYPKFAVLSSIGGLEAVKIDTAFNQLFVMLEPGIAPEIENFGKVPSIQQYRNEAETYIRELRQSIISDSINPVGALNKRLGDDRFKYYNGGPASYYMFVGSDGAIYNTNLEEYTLDSTSTKVLAEILMNEVSDIREVKIEYIPEMIAPDYKYDGVSGFSFLARESEIKAKMGIDKKFDEAVKKIVVEVNV